MIQAMVGIIITPEWAGLLDFQTRRSSTYAGYRQAKQSPGVYARALFCDCLT
jgi:hypothetical protein